jgi:hypothetical protein
MSAPTPLFSPLRPGTLGKHEEWAEELEELLEFAREYRLDTFLSTASHQLAKLMGPDVKLVVYPHRTKSTGNTNLRIRNEGSRNLERAAALMSLSGLWVRLSDKNMKTVPIRLNMSDKERAVLVEIAKAPPAPPPPKPPTAVVRRRLEREAKITAIEPLCAEEGCGGLGELVRGVTIYPHRPDLHGLPFYRCPRCAAYVGCHPHTELALGRPAGPRTRKARNAAHEAFDPMWKAKAFRDAVAYSEARGAGYAWLAAELGYEPGRCHIAWMTAEEADRVTELCRRFYRKD